MYESMIHGRTRRMTRMKTRIFEIKRDEYVQKLDFSSISTVNDKELNQDCDTSFIASSDELDISILSTMSFSDNSSDDEDYEEDKINNLEKKSDGSKQKAENNQFQIALSSNNKNVHKRKKSKKRKFKMIEMSDNDLTSTPPAKKLKRL